jgi:hypothetical protein
MYKNRNMGSFLAQIVHAVHLCCVVFFTLAWLIPSPKAWVLHICLTPLMVLQWRLNRDMCLLTNLELWLKTGKWFPEVLEAGQFLQSLHKKVRGFSADEKTLCRLTYGVLSGSAVLSLVRLLISGSS